MVVFVVAAAAPPAGAVYVLEQPLKDADIAVHENVDLIVRVGALLSEVDRSGGTGRG